MPITLKDIADRTGVSPSVVSTVLSGRDNGTFVSKETRERVKRMALELKYSPVRSGRPRGSRRLRRQRVDQFVGLWVPEFDTASGQAVQALLEAMRHYAAEHSTGQDEDYDFGLRLLSDEDLPRLDMLGVMGLIIVGDIGLPRTAAAASTPTVLLGEVDQLPKEVVTVHMDNFAAGRTIGEYLWELGHRRIAFIAPRERAKVTRQRWHGIQSVWVDHGAREDWCEAGPYDDAPGATIGERVVYTVTRIFTPGSDKSGSEMPTAIAAFDETVAYYALRGLHLLGKSVPNDVSLVGFGDSPNVAEAMTPMLTSVKPPLSQLATTSIAQLFSLHREAETDSGRAKIAGGDRRELAFPGQLVKRDSTGPIR